MNTLQEVTDEIKLCRKNNRAAVFKKMFPGVPNWETFIENINYSSTIESSRLNTLPEMGLDKIHGSSLIRDDFYIQSLHKISDEIFKEQIDLVNFFNKVYNENTKGGTAFVNLAKNKKDIDFHRDQWDSIFWQCIGTTKWTILEKGIDAPVQEIILNPGDVAVIPSGVFHGIKIEGPRASIAYGYRVITQDIDNENRDFNRANI